MFDFLVFFIEFFVEGLVCGAELIEIMFDFFTCCAVFCGDGL
jgi:hypothetical protein